MRDWWTPQDAARFEKEAKVFGDQYAKYEAVPGAFVPEEDEGYFITIVQAPSGASIEYTTNIMKDVEQIYFKQPEIAGCHQTFGSSKPRAA